MKVLLVANGFPPRGRFGTEFYTGELARGLVARGCTVRAVHPVFGSDMSRRERAIGSFGIEVDELHVPMQSSRALHHAWRSEWVERVFAQVLDEFAPDVVHFTQLLWGLSLRCVDLAHARGVRTVLTLTDYGLLCHRGQMVTAKLERCGGPHPAATCARCLRRVPTWQYGGLHAAVHAVVAETAAFLGGLGGAVTSADVQAREDAVRAALQLVDAVIAPTPSMAAAFEGRLPRPATVLPYAFDTTSFGSTALDAASGPERPPRDPARFRIGFIGQLAPHKGPQVLVPAFARARDELAKRGCRAELVLVGATPSGRYARFASALLESLPEGARVEPAFEPDRAAAVLADLDALAVPSLWDENAPLVCLEARAAGVPIVGSRVPGIEAVVQQGTNGLLVEPGDVAALAEALVRAAQFGAAPRGLPVSLDEHLDAVLALYRG